MFIPWHDKQYLWTVSTSAYRRDRWDTLVCIKEKKFKEIKISQDRNFKMSQQPK
jgi:hypothetical protein